MRFIADLHIHSHFSRATSRNLDPENLTLWAQKKGITVIGTGDFTHPGWMEELREKLVEAESGLYRLRPDLEEVIGKEIPESCRRQVRFLLSGEISCIYKRGGKTRKIHHLILMPDFESVTRLNKNLDRVGNITSDGRPILGLDSKNLMEIILEASDRAFFIPAHVWTPWFSLFGSKSGFDAIEECFEDLTPHIHALETGLSSDPPMNRLLSALDDYLLVSNSDAHSPSKLGREANIFDTELDYGQILEAMISREGFEGTIEFYPEEGKYHLDGHRKCNVRFHPEETKQNGGICPSCGKALTVGVLHRVVELSDRDSPKISKDFYSLIPLTEILSEVLCCGATTKKVSSAYEEMLSTFGPELGILMNVPLKDIEDAGSILTATAIDRMRQGKVIRQEGYDGEYGVIRLFHEGEMAELTGQRTLFKTIKKEVFAKKKPLPFEDLRLDTRCDSIDRGKASLLDPVLDPLNSEQKEAVLHRGSHLLIVAGPGTGKTMTLTHRIAYLIRSNLVSPEQVLALTFTNKASREMRERIDTLLPKDKSAKIFVSTFHGFCLEILRNETETLNLSSGFNICSEHDSSILIQQVVSESASGKILASKLQKALPKLKKSSLIHDEKIKKQEGLFTLFQKYQEKLRTLGMLDLDDLEVETLRLFKDSPEVSIKYSRRFPWIFVDEYQDISPLQSALLKDLVKKGVNEICAIGDPDQAIYGFRGTDAGIFNRFVEDFQGAKEIFLSKNYRSTQVILRGASEFMGKEKPLEATIGKGGPINIGACVTYSEEAEMVVEQIEKLLGGTTYFSLDSGRVSSHEDNDDLGFGDIAVLYRLNSQGDEFVKAFSRAGIPFIRSGEKALINQYPVNILWRFLQTLYYPDIDYYLKTYMDLSGQNGLTKEQISKDSKLKGSIEEIIDHVLSLHKFDFSSKESEDAVRRLKDIAENMEGGMGTFLDRLCLDRGIDHTVLSGDRVALMSLHAAKGLEWPVVFVTGCEDKLIPCSLFGDSDTEEEKRLFYVGMTRARRRLILSYTRRRKINDRMLDMNPSFFLTLIRDELCEPLERSEWKPKRKKHSQLELFPE